MTPEPDSLTRRDALLGALKGAVAAALAVPPIAAAQTQPSAPEPPFVPENDYPYFGCDPEALG